MMLFQETHSPERLQSVRETVSLLYNRIINNIECGREKLKDIEEKEETQKEEETKEEEKEQVEGNIDVTLTKNKRALKGAYGSFIILWLPNVEINTYVLTLIKSNHISKH